jgi:hypothetical protein
MRYIGLDVHREFCEVAILDHVSLFGAGVRARPITLPVSKPREAAEIAPRWVIWT